MLVASSAFVLGVLHGLGADHLMAIAVLAVSDPARATTAPRRALRVAVQFACGHAVLLAVGAALVVYLGYQLPILVEQVGELMAGCVLICLGAAGLWAVATGRLYAHSHPHGRPPTIAWHWHLGRPDHHPESGRHVRLPAVLGAVFAVSGLRALTLLAPFGPQSAESSLLWFLGLILLFALGIVVSMTLFGVVLARLLSTRVVAALGRGAAFVMALASIILGCYWVAA